MTIRVYDDAAIAVGKQVQAGGFQDRDVRGRFRSTQFFVRQEGQWRAAGLHLSPLAEE